MSIRYLSLHGLAERVGIGYTTARTYNSQKRLPPPDAIIGNGNAAKYGWLPETVDEWNMNRPGQGARTDISGAKLARIKASRHN